MNKKICFISLNAYSILTDRNNVYGGGPEILQSYLAKELVKYNYDITFIVYGDKAGIEYSQDGIKIIKIPCRYSTLIVKAFYVWKSMLDINADIYYHHSGAVIIVALFSKFYRKRYILHIGSDACVSKTELRYMLWKLDIKFADLIILQTIKQKLLLKKNYKRDGIIIKNYFPIYNIEKPKKEIPPIILWVGSIVKIKNPILFIKLAKNIPEGKFIMIGGKGDDHMLFKQVCYLAKKIPNLNYLGYISFNEINIYFQRASILVNTSLFEGFPNAFIQAWMNYTPVVSLNVDPDNIIKKYALGYHSQNFNKMIMDVKRLIKNMNIREIMGLNAKKYLLREYDLNEIIRKYMKILG